MKKKTAMRPLPHRVRLLLPGAGHRTAPLLDAPINRRAVLTGGILAATALIANPVFSASTEFGPVRSVGDYLSALAFVGSRNRFAVIDVAAEWCAFCRILDQRILPDRDVRNVMANLALIRVDVTAMDPDNLALLSHLRVDGPPTVFVVDTRKSSEIAGSRSVGAFDAASLVERLAPFSR